MTNSPVTSRIFPGRDGAASSDTFPLTDIIIRSGMKIILEPYPTFLVYLKITVSSGNLLHFTVLDFNLIFHFLTSIFQIIVKN